MDLPKMIREQTVEFIDSQEIDRKINESVKEVVISSVKHAMRAPLRARFKDLPTSDMKEILLQRIYGSGGTKKKVNKILKLLRPWVSIFTTTSSPTTVRRIQGIWHNTRASEFCSSSYLTSSVIIHSFGRSVNKLRGSKTPILLLQVQLELSWWENLSLKSDRSLQDLLGLFHHLSEPCQQTRASALKSYICTCTEKNLNCSHRGYGDVFMDWYCKRQGITHLVQKSEATSMGGELAIITIQPDYFFIKRSGVSYDMVARDEQQDFRQKKDVGQSRSSCSHYPETAKDTTYLPESGEALLVDGFEKATTGDLLKLNVLAPPYCATLFRISLHQFIKGEKIGTCSLDSPDAGGITQDNPLKILRVLRIILVVLPEHLSDTKVLTMKMEILLEPHQLALEFLLKMNLPDHRIKQRWRWRHLVPVESIHHPMLTLNVSNCVLTTVLETVRKVPDIEDTIIFKLDSQEIIESVNIEIIDMFRNTLQLPVETLEKPFVAPVNIEIIESFMHTVGYQGVIDKEIRVTNDYKEYETVFGNVAVPMNQPQPVVSNQGTHRSIPRAHRTPTLTTASAQGKKRKQSAGESSSPKITESKNINKEVVEGEKDVELYVDKFAASMIHDDVDDFGDRIETGSDKENLKVDDDDDNKEEKKDDEMGSLETRTEKMQTPIPTTPRSPRINLSSDKNIAQELTDTVSLSTATTSKD
ncbi:hypothetical protein Tco_1401749 [Tanacetum coccineum]